MVETCSRRVYAAYRSTVVLDLTKNVYRHSLTNTVGWQYPPPKIQEFLNRWSYSLLVTTPTELTRLAARARQTLNVPKHCAYQSAFVCGFIALVKGDNLEQRNSALRIRRTSLRKPMLYFQGILSYYADLRRESAAPRLLKLRFPIPLGNWIFFCCKCWVLLGCGHWDELITNRLWCVVVCGLGTS